MNPDVASAWRAWRSRRADVAGRRPWRGNLPLAGLLPLLAVAAWAVTLVQRVPALVQSSASSDSVGPMVIADALPAAPRGSQVVMGNAGHYSTLGFDLLTGWLPGHHTLWQAMPYVLSLLGLLLLAATVRRVAGSGAALVALAIGIATPPLLITPLLAQAFHNVTYANAVVLGALLVALARAPRRRRAPAWLALCAVVAVATGIDVASDPLLLPAGLVPFVAAPAVLALQRRRGALELLAVCAAVAVAALAAAGVTAVAMDRAGLVVAALPWHLAGSAQLRSNLSLTGHLLLDFGNGQLSLHGLGGWGLVRLLCALAVIAAVLVPPLMLAAVALRRDAPGELDAAPAAGVETLPRAAHMAYWGLVAVLVTLAFAATTLPRDTSAIRYLLPVFYAVAATVPLLSLALRPARLGVPALVAFVALSGVVLFRDSTAVATSPAQQQAADLVAALDAQGLHHGYAGYWQADLLTWQSDGRIRSRAVQQAPRCQADQPGWFCPFTIFSISSWYRPEPGPSFLIRDPLGGYLSTAPAAPAPLRELTVDGLVVDVYAGDIGALAAQHTALWPSP